MSNRDWIYEEYVKGLLNKSSSSSSSDYYIENGFRVFTEEFHKKRGFCCGSGCRHCPYNPKHKKGTKSIMI